MATEKEIPVLFSHLLVHCVYSCCGSLAFTVICFIAFTAVVDPWPLQLYASLPLQLLWVLGLNSYLLILGLYTVDPWSLVFASLAIQLLWILGL